MKQKLFFLCCLFVSSTVIAQSGQNKFTVLGDAEAKYTATSGESGFGDINFKPIFLWKISDKLFVESEIEIETGDGQVDVGLEYANMCYMVNPYLILHAGRFLPKFGAYRGRMGEAFINKFADESSLGILQSRPATRPASCP